MASLATRQTNCWSPIRTTPSGFSIRVRVAGNKSARASTKAIGLPRHIGLQCPRVPLAISNDAHGARSQLTVHHSAFTIYRPPPTIRTRSSRQALPTPSSPATPSKQSSKISAKFAGYFPLPAHTCCMIFSSAFSNGGQSAAFAFLRHTGAPSVQLQGGWNESAPAFAPEKRKTAGAIHREGENN